MREVRTAAAEIRSANLGLMQQLALAKRENDRLSQVAGRQAGIQGGYDFMLSDNSGIAIDGGTVLGIDRLGTRSVTANLSSGGDTTRTVLTSGQAINYRNPQGRACSVVLLSIHGGAASFKTHCGA